MRLASAGQQMCAGRLIPLPRGARPALERPGADQQGQPLPGWAGRPLQQQRCPADAAGPRYGARTRAGPIVRNPFKSLLLLMVETVLACEEALRICEDYEEPERSCIEAPIRAGIGFGVTEAPRGMCWHTYGIDDASHILDVRIVPPTSQNQRQIDLRNVLEANLHLADDVLQWRCEQTIRNYDPCISCATRFIEIHIDRG